MALIHVNFFSEALGMCASCDVVLPQRASRQIGMAAATRGDKHPTLWLLHGASDDQTIWQRRTSIERYAAALGLAVVMPAVGLSSYADMAHGGAYYTYVSKELPKIMRSMFPLSDRREDNFIAGLSMGGMGALKIAMRRPENYAAICCLSAGHTNYRFHEPKEGTPRFNRYLVAYGEAGPLPSEEETLARARALAEAGGPWILPEHPLEKFCSVSLSPAGVIQIDLFQHYGDASDFTGVEGCQIGESHHFFSFPEGNAS